MHRSDLREPLFQQAVAAIDSGEIDTLRTLLEAHPRLLRDRLEIPEKGYFDHPYLMWFVADNPIRNGKLPGNIADVTRMLINEVRQYAPETFSFQIDYTLGLVVTGRIPKECGVQTALIDLLVDSGATPGSALGAIAHGNPEAAAHLIFRGGNLTFAAAVGLGWEKDIERLATAATQDDWNLALIVAGFRGDAPMIRYLLDGKASVNEVPADCKGFHAHATALHQAVSSGSLDGVKVLVDAGADLQSRDRVYQGTPLDWVNYLSTEERMDEELKVKYRAIGTYLEKTIADIP